MSLIWVGSELLVNTQTSGVQSHSAIVYLANGGFVVVWQDSSDPQGDLSAYSVKARMFDSAGIPVGAEFLVNTQTAGNQFSPAVTGLANGGFVISWTDESSTLGDIKAQVYDAIGGRVNDEFLVNTYTANSQHFSTITALSDGNFVVSWRDNSGTLGDASFSSIKARVFNSSGTAISAEERINTQRIGNQLEPNIAALSNGGFVVTWTDDNEPVTDISSFSVKAQVYDAQINRVGGEFLVNTNTNSDQEDSAVTGLANGGFVVVWTDRSGTLFDNEGTSIKARLYDNSGNRVGDEFRVNNVTAGFQYTPSVASLDNGGFVVSWIDGSGVIGDDSGWAITAQVFGADGSHLGAQFLVNSQIESDQLRPSVTGLANGNFVISWEDSSPLLGDGSDSSIKAQIFLFDADGETPTITSNGGGSVAAINIAENSFDVTTVTADDEQSNILTFAISGGADAALFSIDQVTGILNFLVATDFETPNDAYSNNVYEVIVSASDGINIDTQTLRVKVTDVDDGNTINGTGADDIINTTVAPIGQPKATAFDDLIFGNAGNDKIDGGAGGDEMHGGTGNDTFTIDTTADQVIEFAGEGKDTIVSALVDVVLTANVERGALSGSFDLGITGNELANVLFGNSGANMLFGGDGNDTLNGEGGNDLLVGGDGIDKLTGGSGADVLTGGAAADQFRFETAMLADGLFASDTITDFSGIGGDGDRINLLLIDANGNSADGDQAFAFVGASAFTGAAGQLRYAQSGGDTYLFGDTDGDGIADFQIIVTGLHTFAVSDFLL